MVPATGMASVPINTHCAEAGTEMEQEAWGIGSHRAESSSVLLPQPAPLGHSQSVQGHGCLGGRKLFSILKHWKELLREDRVAWLCENATFLHVQNKSHVLWL